MPVARRNPRTTHLARAIHSHRRIPPSAKPLGWGLAPMIAANGGIRTMAPCGFHPSKIQAIRLTRICTEATNRLAVSAANPNGLSTHPMR